MNRLRVFFSSLWERITRNNEDPDDDEDPNPGDEEQATWSTKKANQRTFLWIVIVCLVGTGLLMLFTEPVTKTVTTTVDGQNKEIQVVVFSWVKFWWYTVALYVIVSYRFWSPVPTGQQGALAFLENPYANVLAGASFAPLLFVTVKMVPAQTPQREFPAEPENIDRTPLKEGYVMPKHKKPPLRIQFRDSISDAQARILFGKGEGEEGEGDELGDYIAQSISGEKVKFTAEVPAEPDSAAQKAADGLSKRLTAEVQHVARIRIDNPCLFLTNVPPGNTGIQLEEAFSQIEDEMVKVINQYFTRMSVAQALMNIKWISIHLQNAVDRRVGGTGHRRSWGIDVQAAFVKLIHTDHGVNIAISEAAQAPFQKSKTIIAAEGKRQQLELEGKGTGSAARDLAQGTLEGQATGLQDVAFKLEISGEKALAAEVAQSIGENGNTFIAGLDGFGQLAGIAAATLGKNKKDKPEPTPEEGDDS